MTGIRRRVTPFVEEVLNSILQDRQQFDETIIDQVFLAIEVSDRWRNQHAAFVAETHNANAEIGRAVRSSLQADRIYTNAGTVRKVKSRSKLVSKITLLRPRQGRELRLELSEDITVGETVLQAKAQTVQKKQILIETICTVRVTVADAEELADRIAGNNNPQEDPVGQYAWDLIKEWIAKAKGGFDSPKSTAISLFTIYNAACMFWGIAEMLSGFL